MSLPSPDALRAAALRLPRLPSAPTSSGPVAIAVSGGADSIYLLCALWADEALRPRLRVLHFDHRVRGEASAEDARFVAALCASLAVPCVVGVRSGQGMSSEAELRAGRDAFFAAQRTALGCELLCTAHHLDDVVENALMRLARGAGLAGLAAPRVLQSFHDGHRRWRPLIQAGLAKPALLAGLQAAGIPWREDATNLLPIAARNRVRAWLAAGGAEAMGEGYAQGFGRSARILGEAQVALAQWACELGCVVGPDGTMPIAALQGRPSALIQESLRAFLHAHEVTDPSESSLAPLAAAIAAGREARASVRGRLVRVVAGALSIPQEPLVFGADERRLAFGMPDDEPIEHPWVTKSVENAQKKVLEWVRAGGKLIAIENALGLFANKESFALKSFDSDEEKKAAEKAAVELAKQERLEPYTEGERLEIASGVAGAIYQIDMDQTHPLGYGTGGKFYSLKNNADRFAYLTDGVNAGVIAGNDSYRTGYIGYKIKSKMGQSMAIGAERQGRGQLVYFVDNPIFRGFWESGKLILSNAVFL
ncbi:MAG: tRNA lysidine(34) synthetase TilS, partial [Verrucomicrobia bacterium]